MKGFHKCECQYWTQKAPPGHEKKDSSFILFGLSEFTLQLQGWNKPRRFIVVRERVRESKSAVGRKLLDVPGYTFRIFVTNRTEDALTLWRDYNKRAVIAQRIEELKAEPNADGFCMKSFFATESAFLSVLFTFKLLSLYQQANEPKDHYRLGQGRTSFQLVFHYFGATAPSTGLFHQGLLHPPTDRTRYVKIRTPSFPY